MGYRARHAVFDRRVIHRGDGHRLWYVPLAGVNVSTVSDNATWESGVNVTVTSAVGWAGQLNGIAVVDCSIESRIRVGTLLQALTTGHLIRG